LLFSFSSKSTISSSVALATLFPSRYFSQTVALQANFGELFSSTRHYWIIIITKKETSDYIEQASGALWKEELSRQANQSDPPHRNKGQDANKCWNVRPKFQKPPEVVTYTKRLVVVWHVIPRTDLASGRCCEDFVKCGRQFHQPAMSYVK
jgi:hypothetical protein